MSAPPVTEDLGQVTDDAFLGGRVRIFQPTSGYRAGVDAVLLAAAVAPAADRVEGLLDCGAGAGTAGLCAAVRLGGAIRVVLLEREERLTAIARENVRRNGLDGSVRVVRGEVGASAARLAELGLEAASFDHVIANPPFHAEGHGTPSQEPLKAGAHAMKREGLAEWARFLARMAAADATATLIHKATELRDVLDVLDGRFGALRILPVYARADTPAIRVIVQGRKNSKAPTALLPGFVLHGSGNAFTPAADAILRGGEALHI